MRIFKEDFRKWLLDWNAQNRMGHIKFKFLHESMKWGLYVDFLDSNGIMISLLFDDQTSDFEWNIHLDGVFIVEERPFETRTPARKSALEMAIRIYEQ